MDLFKNIEFTYEFCFVVILPLITGFHHALRNLAVSKWFQIEAEVLDTKTDGSHFDSGDLGYSQFIKVKFVMDGEEKIRNVPYKVGRLPIQMPFTSQAIKSGFKTGDKITIYINPKDKTEIVFSKRVFDVGFAICLAFSFLALFFFL